MPIQFFNTESGTAGECPFINEYLEKNKVKGNPIFDVDDVTLATSGKGYMLRTQAFQVWLWKNSSVAKQLVEALDIWVAKGIGYNLIIQIDSKAKDGYLIGTDKDKQVTWFNVGKKYSTSELSVSTPTGDGNPFL